MSRAINLNFILQHKPRYFNWRSETCTSYETLEKLCCVQNEMFFKIIFWISVGIFKSVIYFPTLFVKVLGLHI